MRLQISNDEKDSKSLKITSRSKWAKGIKFSNYSWKWVFVTVSSVKKYFDRI